MMKFLVTVSQSSKPLSYTTLALTSALTQLLFSMTFQDWQCDIQNNQGQGKCYTILQKPNLTPVLLYIVLTKIRTNTPASNGTQFDIALENHALCAQPRDWSLIC